MRKIILLVILVCIAIIVFFRFDFAKDSNIIAKIGIDQTHDIQSIRTYYTIQGSLEKYFTLLEEGELDKAYSLLSVENKEYLSKEQYKAYIKEHMPTDYKITNIEEKNVNVYLVDVLVGEEAFNYLVYVDSLNNTFSVSIDNFVYYETVKEKVNNFDFSFQINDYKVETNRIVFDVVVKNKKSKEDLEISNLNLKVNAGLATREEESIVLLPKETREIKLVFETTNIGFPETLYIIENDPKDNQTKTYTINF